MKHYICTGGCGAVSENPGICQDSVCAEKGHDFKECNCIDGKHAGLITACLDCGELCKAEGGCKIESFKEELE